MNVVVTGSIGLDYIMNFPGRFADRIMPERIHKISLSFLAEKLSKQMGGTAGNFAYTAKLLGLTPLTLSTAGNDFSAYKAFLTKHKIPTKYIAVDPNDTTGTYFVLTDIEDNQIGTFYVGAMRKNDLLSLKQITEKVDFVHIAPNKPEAMIKVVSECKTMKLPYMYDPAFQIGALSDSALRDGIDGAAIVIVNDYELELIKEKLSVTMEELLLMAPIVITTLGAKGSVIETRKESIHVPPAKPKNATDPTGAGDAYRAGFVAGYLKVSASSPGPLRRSAPPRLLSRLGRSEAGGEASLGHAALSADQLLVCGQMGSVAAVYTVEKYGTVTHYFTKKEFIQRYKDNYGETISL